MKTENYRNLKNIADYYGYENQSRQLIEEMAELTQVINKLWRATRTNREIVNPVKDNIRTIYENLFEEIANVEICTEQIKYLLKCSDEVESIKDVKINRQLDRMNKEV